MAELAEFEARMVGAFERIRAGVSGLAAAAAGPSAQDLAQIEAALAAEKEANAQLEERVKALHERQSGQVASLEARVAAQGAELSALADAVSRLQTVNGELREINTRLREANEGAVGEPHLINKAMLAELEALRAARGADRAELDAVLGRLSAVVGEAS